MRSVEHPILVYVINEGPILLNEISGAPHINNKEFFVYYTYSRTQLYFT